MGDCPPIEAVLPCRNPLARNPDCRLVSFSVFTVEIAYLFQLPGHRCAIRLVGGGSETTSELHETIRRPLSLQKPQAA